MILVSEKGYKTFNVTGNLHGARYAHGGNRLGSIGTTDLGSILACNQQRGQCFDADSDQSFRGYFTGGTVFVKQWRKLRNDIASDSNKAVDNLFPYLRSP